MILLFLAWSASAADPVRFPLAATVRLPEVGAVRVHVPPELRSASDALLLVDATGREVPFARLTEAQTYTGLVPKARVTPTADPEEWQVDVGDRRADGLRVDLAGPAFAATVTVRSAEDVVGGGLVWRIPTGSRLEVPIRPTAGRLAVHLAVHSGGLRHPPEIDALRLRAPGVDADVVRVPVASWQVQENGWARYLVVPPRPFPVSAVRLDPAERVFERSAWAEWTSAEWALAADGLSGAESWPLEARPIRRVQLGDTFVEDLTLPVRGADDQLTLLVDANGKPPLVIPEVDLLIPGLHLVVRDAGPGPHTLYAGAPPGTSPAWDLQAAAPELARDATVVVSPEPARPHDGWVAPEIRANLVEPSTEIALAGFAWTHAVHGTGLARIPLTDEVLAHARVDLGDLRLVTEDGRQVPYLLRRRGGEHAWPDVPVSRTERGGTSVLELRLPWADVPVSSVHVTTSAPLFERIVTLARPAGTALHPVRAVRWVGSDRPTTLGLEVGQRVGDTLVLTVDNGNDPPLPIDAVEVRWPAWELIATLPDAPVSLYYGDPRRGPPAYDLGLLRDDLRVRATASATLGPRAARTPPPLSALDQGMLLVGVGVMALGLVGLLLALIRATPDTEVPADP